MRRLLTAILLAAGLAALAPVAEAGSYTINTTAAQDVRLDRARLKANAATCATVNIPFPCLDSDVKAINASLTIYPDVQSYLVSVLASSLSDIVGVQSREDASNACVAFKALTNTQKNTLCGNLGVTSSVATPCALCQ